MSIIENNSKLFANHIANITDTLEQTSAAELKNQTEITSKNYETITALFQTLKHKNKSKNDFMQYMNMKNIYKVYKKTMCKYTKI